MRTTPTFRAALAGAIAIVAWAAAYPAIRVGLRAYPPGELAALRYLVASAVFAVCFPWHRQTLPRGRDLFLISLAGAIGISAYNLLLNTGELTASAGAGVPSGCRQAEDPWSPLEARTEMPLAEVLAQPFVAELLPPLLERHREAIDLIRSRAEEREGTIFFDITDHQLEGFNKFIPYYLYPNATYSIGLSRSSFRTKVAVGSNPWTKADPAKMVNLAEVCERYGGGGHARVGAISFPPDRGEEARKAAAEIVAELRATNPFA